MKKLLDYTRQDEFGKHITASSGDIGEFIANRHPGPDIADLHLDMHGGVTSDWNAKAFHLIRDEFCKDMAEANKIPYVRPAEYYIEMIKEKYSRLQVQWRKCQPKIKEDGALESWAEVEDRLKAACEITAPASRRTSRRVTVRTPTLLLHNFLTEIQRYGFRLQMLSYMLSQPGIDSKTRESLEFWVNLVEQLGKDGMSSEDSDPQEDGRSYRVKNMPWRRHEITNYMEYIDSRRNMPGFRSNSGNSPIKRRRDEFYKESDREPCVGLPKVLYDADWLGGVDENNMIMLGVSDEPFTWLSIKETRGEQR